MSRYSILPPELRLMIMDILIEDGERTSLYRLISASPSDFRVFVAYQTSLLCNLTATMLNGAAGPDFSMRQTIAREAMDPLRRPRATPLSALSRSEHTELITLSAEVQRITVHVSEPERTLLIGTMMRATSGLMGMSLDD
jgi:hypothetical protein